MTNDQTKIRLGTRGSKLAMWQSNWVKAQLESAGHTVELIQIKTQGDIKTGPLAQIGGQGLFTKALQVALLENEIDIAVHSLKDLPTNDIPGLAIRAIPERESTQDALVSDKYKSFADLPQGAIVGTGSVRRAAQLLHLRGDLNIKDIRGNVDTRLEKLDSGQFDAIILAAAGLNRLELDSRITQRFETDQLYPAVGQGALGIEARKDADDAIGTAIESLNHADSFSRAMAERHMLRRLFAGCLAPVGAKTTIDGGKVSLEGVVLSPDGATVVSAQRSRPVDQFEALGIEVAEALIAGGADKLLGHESSQ